MYLSLSLKEHVYSDHYSWSGQNNYLYPYLADKNDVDQFEKFSRNLELKRKAGKKCLQTLQRSALPPDTSLEQLWATSASAGGQEDQVLPIDTLVSNYYAAILWVVTPSVSSYVCFCTLSSTHLDWISQSLRQNTLKQENPVLPLASRLSPAASLYISWRTSSRATPCDQTNCRTVCYYFTRESCQIFFKNETKKIFHLELNPA